MNPGPVTFALLLGALFFGENSARPDTTWPEPTPQNRPWTRWWWLGSAVDQTNLTRQLEQFRNAGIGGVEICPIYGVKGHEQRHIPFLSAPWMQMLAHTTAEARRLGLGVDLTTGTGWPFGGPWVGPDIASAKVILKRYNVAPGERLTTRVPDGELQGVVAFSDTGEHVDLTAKVRDRQLDWTAPPGRWLVYAVSQGSPVQKVKRAAPGGEGSVLDPFSVSALNRYLAPFDAALAGLRAPMPRAQFHDSFEYYGATWTRDLFAEFKQRRGYDLRAQLPALFGEGDADTIARVKCDYRETISDLHLDYLRRWTEWAHGRGSLTRNQAHGAPGNLVDLYAAVDIPETEIFGSFDEKHIPMQKFASAAAHLSGRTLVSAESFTWLDEHFQASLAEVKQAADYLFLAGINHIFFHGIPYSPADAAWPGWQFYAAVNFGPQGGLWRDLPFLNAYVQRCQSVLQGGQPDNDVLLYFPMHDLFQTPSELLIPLTVHNVEKVLGPHPFHAAAMTLWNRGYGFDAVSDRFLENARCVDGRIALGETPYRAIVVPRLRVIPETTMRRLAQLAEAGATIVIQEALPTDVPGFAGQERRRAEFRTALGSLRWQTNAESGIRRGAAGSGAFLVGKDLDAVLASAGVKRESCVDAGLRFIRRRSTNGHDYFFANRGERTFSGWITLATAAKSAVLLDPRLANRAGAAAVRERAGATAVFLQLAPGESAILRTLSQRAADGSAWQYERNAAAGTALATGWRIEFIEGGPELPRPATMSKLASWTTLDDPEVKRFAGTARYSMEFENPGAAAEDWLLDLGRVRESARVRLNGRDVGALWCPPFHLRVGSFLQPGRNLLEIEVTNLAANRVADLDRRKVNWKYFYDINMASKHYRSLDASNWPLFESGLPGPVTLTPLKHFRPE